MANQSSDRKSDNRHKSAGASVDALVEALAAERYIADWDLAVPVFLALKLRRPLFLEGEAGVGKTEIA